MPSAASSRSRNSSAHVRVPPAGAGSKDRKNGDGSEWVEPPLERAKASYEDHGGAPFGVLEDMLPLGQPPNAKVKSRVRADAAGSKKGALGKNAAGLVSDTQDTPEMTPALDGPSATIDAAALPTQPLLIFDDEKDQDYTPRQSKKSAKARVSRSSLARTAASSPTTSTPAHQTQPVISEEPAQSPATASSTARNGTAAVAAKKRAHRSTTPLKSASTQVNVPITNLDAIIDAAVKKSREVNNPSLGNALRELHRDSLHDQKLMDLLVAILNRSASVQEVKTFKAHIRRVKKRIREESARKGGKSPAVKNGTTSSTSTSPPKPPPELIPRQSIEAPTNMPRPKISIRVNPSKKPKLPATSSRPRSESVSSSSSLSSLTSNGEDDGAMDIDVGDVTTAQLPTPMPASSPGVTKQNQSHPTNGLSTPQATGVASLKRSSAEADVDDREEILAAKKQKFSESVDRKDRSHPSFVRDELVAPSQSVRTINNPIVPPVQLTANGHTTQAPANREVSVDPGSPLTDISTPPASQQGTPLTASNPTKMIKKKAKTKQSPMKKQAVNYGGEANGSGEVVSPIGYDDNEESDNNDFCSSCRGSGYLLCCDGCDRSFHFACLDPPLTQEASELQEPWFCFQCVAKRAQPQKHQRGLFSTLLTNLDKRNPSTFSLPQDIRDYFEGTATAKDGRFVEAVNGKTRTRAGYDELPDNFKIKDSKGQSILCYHCGKSSVGRREIITCDQCSAHWHLDCLDPPLANTPHRDQWGRKVRDWLCPLHIDHELRELDVSRLADRQLERDRKVFMRKPRNAKIVDTSLNRGFVNEGIIEVINDESEEESEFYDEEVSGVVYRLPEKGIKLDFIDRVHQTRNTPQPVTAISPAVQAPSRLGQADFVKRSFLEQQTALSLVQFATQEEGVDLGSDQIENLLGALIAEAPEDVAAQMLESRKAQSDQQRKNLELLQTLIGKKLQALAS